MKALYIASTGMSAQERNVEVISNNIANMRTTGFKRQRAEFQDLLYQKDSRPGATTSADNTRVPSGIQIGSGVRTADIARIGEQGPITRTGNDYDMAIDGKGFFRVTMPGGDLAYTRAGSFRLSPEGMLVTTDGYPVQPEITIPRDVIAVQVSKTGMVQVKLAGQTEMQDVGQLDLALFVNEAGLEAVGSNLFLETDASGQPNVANPGQPGYGMLEQRSLEASNVNPVQEITALISAQRAYEMNSRTVKTADEMLATTSQLR